MGCEKWWRFNSVIETANFQAFKIQFLGGFLGNH